MPHSEHNLIWLDLEMTGLNTDKDFIIEIATIVTDPTLNILAEGPVIAIQQTQKTMESMDNWNTNQHTKSGLYERVLASQYSATDAESITLEFLSELVPENESPMCGNSICQDRRFLHRLMPKLEQYFHYRHLDVSSIKEIIRRWYPTEKSFKKQAAHLALQDIHDSIKELRFYRKSFFKESTVTE